MARSTQLLQRSASSEIRGEVFILGVLSGKPSKLQWGGGGGGAKISSSEVEVSKIAAIVV